ncbi:helix-turn-helix DNA-binding protein [Mycobacterium phage GodPhather]|uniref:Helix-turn-helix DNA binding protein n=1 Tax=Mycobacterium phage Jeon TaxID=2108123 RepID=A0A2P1JRD9_9CAUD|nr:transcriptional regulator [Mycobacterium phage Jeon]AVO21704.1 helix-turn-helix DNA-binding protein [Mycobacterium phage Jeon]QBP32574.1 helix-turn-helix DNA-binding protein [Mycobacterium phage GodPhather]
MMGGYEHGQGARLRSLRDYLGLSAKEIADELGVSIRSYQNFESGRAAIPTGVLNEVADMVHKLDELAGAYSEQDELSLAGMTTIQRRAAGIAAAANPELRLTP